MGLSVISQLTTTANMNPCPGSSDPGAALPGEFATLLSGQTMAALMSLGQGVSIDAKPLADGSSTAESSTDDSVSEGGLSLIDPAALIAMLGNPQIQAAVQHQPTTAETRDATIPSVPLQSGEDGHLAAMNGTIASVSELGDKENPRGIPAASSAPPPINPQNSIAAQASTLQLAEKPMRDAANIAAQAETSTGNTPAFSEVAANSLQQRGIAAGHQTSKIGVEAPLHTPAWPQQFSEKVIWMAKNDLQSAQININPPQLGPLQITLSMNGDQASAVFASPHAEVRQAIETSMPQLKEMLASAGISLGDTNVGANLAQQNQNSPFLTPNRTQSTLENAILPANDNAPGAGVATPLHQGRGLVDLFA